MRVRIGVADTAREIELDVDDVDAFKEMLEESHTQGNAFVWFDAVDGKRVGVPLTRVAFVEFESAQKVSVGFRS
jgi:hypothetical protein